MHVKNYNVHNKNKLNAVRKICCLKHKPMVKTEIT